MPLLLRFFEEYLFRDHAARVFLAADAVHARPMGGRGALLRQKRRTSDQLAGTNTLWNLMDALFARLSMMTPLSDAAKSDRYQD
ncbi:hypothetical protein DMH25_42670 [Streptomyces sp. WAC 01325]|uniref:hypothetical protein n=1 Tax=Streptomyces sp. WAC 01325 TaxID=2203202 RepID=UPI000F889CD3|nr:hypothetical protein [Streptomyces sp. WAC 01325]RSM87101.1 hypothetical protein DMH25_42670 [Streptomyces sp. WAC 01325]